MDNAEFIMMVDEIRTKIGNRTLVFWGSDGQLLSRLREIGIKTGEVYTSNKDLLKNYPDKFLDFNQLNGMSSQLYVVMPFILQDRSGYYQLDVMKKFGYSMNDFYFVHKVNLKNKIAYKDCFNNEVISTSEKVIVSIDGVNNRVILNGTDIEAELNITITGSGNTIDLSNCIIKGRTCINVQKSNNVFLAGKLCRFYETRVLLGGDVNCIIGEETTFNWYDKLWLHSFSDVIIGKDCMFGVDVLVQPGDGHSIFDVNTGENINSFTDVENSIAKYVINLQDHVWLGRNSTIISGNKPTEIGEGSIVAAEALVKGIFPNNVIIAGVPGNVKKKDIAWSRKPRSNDITECGNYCKKTIEK